MTLRRLALVVLTLALLSGGPVTSASADEGVFEDTTLPDYDPATYPTGPYISSEQPDYSPGHTADIRGGGWEPGETVTLIFHPEPQVRADTVMTATANEDGEFMHSEFQLADVDLDTTYTVTAAGESSGYSATTTFTDAATDFYFAYGSGNWNTSTAGTTVNAVWRTCTNAAGTLGCTNQGVSAPTTTANVTTIQSGVTVTIVTNITADEVVVAAGGALVVNAKPTFANGSGTDLTVDGSLTVNATQSVTMAASAAASVAGLATLNGSVLQLASSQVNVGGDFNINSGAVVNGNGTSGASRPTFRVTSGGEVSIASGGSISPTGANPLIVDIDPGGTATVAGAITGPNKIDFDGTVAVTGSVTMTSISDLHVGGDVTLSGTAILTTTRATNGTVGSIVADGSLHLADTAQWSITGIAGASAVVGNDGTLEIDPSAFVTGAGFLDVNGGGRLVVGSDVGINDGTTTGNLRTTATDTFGLTAEYTFDGTAAQITGNALRDVMAGLEVDNSAGVTLSNIGATTSAARRVTDALALTSGDLSTSSNILTLDTGTTCSGTGDVVSTAAGGVKRGDFATPSQVRCFGNPNNTIQLGSPGTAPADITVKLVKSAPTSPAFSTAVQRTYTVTPSGGAGYSATLKLHYNTGDLNGNTESDLELWRSDGSVWTNQGRTGAVDTVNQAVSLSGVTQFSDWTLAGSKLDQTIDFTAPTGITYGDPDFDLAATATSNLPVSYTSNTTSVCTIVSGLLHIVSAGNCSVTASQAGDAAYNAAPEVERSFDLAPKELTVTGITAEDKDYDGNTSATIDTTGALLQGVVGTDDVTLDVSGASGAFDTKDVAEDKTVQISGLALDGTETGNYTLTQPTTTADVDPKELTVTGITAEDKDYDGNTDATIDTTGALLQGVVGAEDVTLDVSGASGAFDTKDVGEDKTVQIAGLTLDGTETGNYTLMQPTTMADIDPQELTVTGITAEDKDYDGNTSATIDTTGAVLNGVVGTEDVTLNTSGASGAFDTKDVGEDKTVQIAGLTLDGTEIGNYTLTQPTTTADIDPQELTVTGITAEDKDYDGNTDATIDTSGATLNGMVGTEDVTLDVSGASGAFLTAAAGEDKTVQISGLVLNGVDKDNYTLTQPATMADIDPQELTVTGITAEDKDYDGNTDATIDTTGALLQGVLGTDDVTLDVSGASGAFDTKDVGEDKTVQISGLVLDGVDKDNYSLTQPTTTADIDPKGLTVTGITAEDKDYDGNTDATIDTTGALLQGVVGAEDVTLDVSGASGAFDTKDVGEDKTVQISGLVLNGVDKDNYTLTQPATMADIDPKELTVTGITAEDKDYDGNTDATIDTTGALLQGVVGTEDVMLNTSGASGAFDTKDVGEDKTVQISGLVLDGVDKDNYLLTQPTAVADIDPKELTVTGITAEDKDYDGNTDATIDTTGALLQGVVGTEDVTLDVSGASGAFLTAAAGEDKTVQISGLALDGTETGNYTLTQPATMADIDPKELTVTGITAEDKEYDGNANATIDTAGALLQGVVGTDDVTLNTSGASGAFLTPGAGPGKTVQISGLTLAGTKKDNYSLTQPTTTADITQAELTINAHNKSRAFNEPNPTPTYSLSGFKNSENASSANVTGDASCSYDAGAGPNAGVYPNAITCAPGTLSAANYTFATGTKGTLTITAANTTLTYSGDSSAQYSDKAHLKATLTSAGNPLEGKTINFKINAQEIQDTTDANGVAEVDLKIDQAPAITSVGARFAGEQNYSQSVTGPQPFEVKREDARATYTGFMDVATSSASSSYATVTLSATIQDITDVLPGSDAEAGDIRKAKVDFVNRDNNAVLCNDLPVGLVSAANTKVGTATCNWSANIGNADGVAYTIGIRVEGWYTRDESTENAVVNVYKPLTTAFITGGGFLVNQSSAGLYAGDPTKKTNFGFNVKYNKSGTNLQGNINTIIRRGAYTYQVKGNAMTSLTSKLTSSPKTATFAGKANIQNITNPLQPLAIDGNATLQVTMSDYGTPGGSDKIGITVLNKAGGVWFASAWTGTRTLEQLLGGGNLTVR